MKLSDNLRKIRKENNMSQEQLAEKLGVSRQAVSKWESGQSYPEMDKVLLICKFFNYNIDELMNENIKVIDENKQSKINFNKYIDDFFEFITKTIDMLSVMTFKQKIKCIFEQIWILIFLIITFLIVGAIGNLVVVGIFGGINYEIFSIIRNVLQSIYIILGLIVGITIFLHIFKTRYLDYYEIVKEETKNENSEEQENNGIQKEAENSKIKKIIEKKREKIIIRDPSHSQSKFLAGIIKIVLLFIKFVVVCCAIGFSIPFISLVALLILSFLFVRTGLIFLGAFLGIISALIINFIILEILYNFIVSKKANKMRMAISFITSLILAGISIGIISIGITKFNYVEENNKIEDTYNIEMTQNLVINVSNNTINYIEDNTDEIKIIVKHSKYYVSNLINNNERAYLYFTPNNYKTMEVIRDIIEDINNKEIKNYYNVNVDVYASKENIEKIKKNKELMYNNMYY